MFSSEDPTEDLVFQSLQNQMEWMHLTGLNFPTNIGAVTSGCRSSTYSAAITMSGLISAKKIHKFPVVRKSNNTSWTAMQTFSKPTHMIPVYSNRQTLVLVQYKPHDSATEMEGIIIF